MVHFTLSEWMSTRTQVCHAIHTTWTLDLCACSLIYVWGWDVRNHEHIQPCVCDWHQRALCQHSAHSECAHPTQLVLLMFSTNVRCLSLRKWRTCLLLDDDLTATTLLCSMHIYIFSTNVHRHFENMSHVFTSRWWSHGKHCCVQCMLVLNGLPDNVIMKVRIAEMKRLWTNIKQNKINQNMTKCGRGSVWQFAQM